MNTKHLQMPKEIHPDSLEKVLGHLPEPRGVEVALLGCFDYSRLLQQAQEFVPGVSFSRTQIPQFALDKPTKELILEIYRRSYDTRDDEGGRSYVTTGKQRAVALRKVFWRDDHVEIHLSPWDADVWYNGQEPECITLMRQELEGTNFPITIHVNKRTIDDVDFS